MRSTSVHLPHAMAYPVAGGVKEYRAPGYPDHALAQERLTKLSPRPADAEQLARLFEDAPQAW
jgi:hypothetical protein